MTMFLKPRTGTECGKCPPFHFSFSRDDSDLELSGEDDEAFVEKPVAAKKTPKAKETKVKFCSKCLLLIDVGQSTSCCQNCEGD